MKLDKDTNIILTGMPAVGKSTIGVLLAKVLGRYFLDTDVYIQAVEDATLQNIIDSRGLAAFCDIEQSHLICIDCTNSVISTGGSAVYSSPAMTHLKQNGIVIFLDLPVEDIEKRLTNLSTRGVVIDPNQTIRSLYEKRLPLYKHWADITINCKNLDHQQSLDVILAAIGQF